MPSGGIGSRFVTVSFCIWESSRYRPPWVKASSRHLRELSMSRLRLSGGYSSTDSSTGHSKGGRPSE